MKTKVTMFKQCVEEAMASNQDTILCAYILCRKAADDEQCL
jgi:hypothetical protein